MKYRNAGRILLLLPLATCLFSSCHKEEKLPYKFAGPWKIDKVETTNYSDKGTKVTSTAVQNNVGTIMLFNQIASGLRDQQLANFRFGATLPQSMADFCVRASIAPTDTFSTYYLAGPHTEDRLTFWVPQPILHELVLYTVSKMERNKMELSYAEVDSQGYLIRREIWHCSIAK